MTPELVITEQRHMLGNQQRHIITPEYPPQPGGVSDYTRQVACGLADEGEDVHVWCPGHSPASAHASDAGVHVHPNLGIIGRADLVSMHAQLDRFPAPRRILVQWVPHGYGQRSMNLPFCRWLLDRAKNNGDVVEIMVHESFLRFERSWRQYGAALIHRLMTITLLQAASRVWFSSPECARLWRPYKLGRPVPFEWLPVPSNVPRMEATAEIQLIRDRYVPQGGILVGHFGTFGEPVRSVLEPILVNMAEAIPEQPLLLMGRGSDEFLSDFVTKHRLPSTNMHAAGALAAEQLSAHIAACDLLIQPYPDGATTKRGSLMAGISHGKPILTTAGSSSEPIWSESHAVALARCGDTPGFVRALRGLLASPGERARMGAAADKLYQEQFDISRTVRRLHAAAATAVVYAS